MKFILGSVAVSVVMLFVASDSFADKVYLKNGDVIEGNILNVSDTATVIKAGVKIFKYDAEKVERVERDNAEDFVNPETEELTEAKRELIKGLLAVNGVEKLIEANVQKALANAPADKRDQYAQLFKTDALVDLLVPVYAERFSTKDLEKMVNFFDSPTGKRFVAVSPDILQETFKVIMGYFQDKSIQ